MCILGATLPHSVPWGLETVHYSLRVSRSSTCLAPAGPSGLNEQMPYFILLLQVGAWLKYWGDTLILPPVDPEVHAAVSLRDSILTSLGLFQLQPGFMHLSTLVTFASSTFWFPHTFMVLYFLIIYLTYILSNLSNLGNYYAKSLHLQLHFHSPRFMGKYLSRHSLCQVQTTVPVKCSTSVYRRLNWFPVAAVTYYH